VKLRNGNVYKSQSDLLVVSI